MAGLTLEEKLKLISQVGTNREIHIQWFDNGVCRIKAPLTDEKMQWLGAGDGIEAAATDFINNSPIKNWKDAQR